ncbi:MAG: hypothetical protein DPW11_01905 [bacterium]|nr:hypothetical protein [Candidatus Microgenomates bacterium CPR3]MCQ3944512.1 hypothetical protein [bacterium]RIK51945.1 MAG: hypothetical protein DCC61_00975 [Candidatus Microgenomates bacterium]
MQDQLNALKAKIQEINSVLITFAATPNQDSIAAALAFYLSLKSSGKKVVVAASQPVTVRDSHLVALDKVKTDIGGNNLVITLNVPEDRVDKVTSNTEGGHLNLIINPREGAEPVTEKDIVFGYSGAVADLILVIGAADLKDVGTLVEKEVELFSSSTIANISNQVGSFGAINITDPSSSNSELVTALLKELALPMDVDIANNLMIGIEAGTDNLSSPNMTADTFEALAVLYRTGARRQVKTIVPQQAKIVADMPIIDTDSRSELKNPSEAGQPVAEPQADWLKPKIYKGGSTN